VGKIVILSERLPYPPTSGTKNLLYNYCKILHEKLGMDVVNISFMEQEDDVSLKPDFISKTYELPNPSGKTKLFNIIIKTFFQRKYPIQVSLFWDLKIKKRIYEILNEEKPDYVIADFIRTTEYFKDFHGYRIADLQDLLSLRYERQLKVNLETINPYGAYLYRMPKATQAFLNIAAIKKVVMRTEIKLLRTFEKNVGSQYDRVMFVARSEGDLFDKIIGQHKSLVVPLGVDYEYFSQELTIEKVSHSIAFMGALNVAHNENGILHFIKHIFQLVLKRTPDARLYIIGGGATEQIKQFASENIILTGKVEDVRIAISSCEVFICPLQFGSGIKTKNLEAMAMGMPVVTTTIGAENIDAQSGADWYIADDNNKFADAIVWLFDDESLRNRIGFSGQLFVKNNFTWAFAEKAFEEVLNNEQ